MQNRLQLTRLQHHAELLHPPKQQPVVRVRQLGSFKSIGTCTCLVCQAQGFIPLQMLPMEPAAMIFTPTGAPPSDWSEPARDQQHSGCHSLYRSSRRDEGGEPS